MKEFKGLIKKQISNQYVVIDLETKIEYKALASGKLRYVRVDEKSSFNVSYGRKTKREQQTLQISPKVGDIVDVIINNEQPFIDNIHPRKNDLYRPDVSNVDQVLLVFSATRPEFSFNLLDKFLVILNEKDLKIILLVTKIDLVDNDELDDLKAKLKYYEEHVETDIYYVNSKQRVGFDYLENIFENKITVLAGQTGVGKSTLLNNLIPEVEIKTQEISEALGRGKHTTRHSELYDFNNGFICDTPGFSRLDLNVYEKEDLKMYYPDFVELSYDCRFNTCNHVQEPGCKVKEMVNDGLVPQERYNNYLLFYEEVTSKKNMF